MLPRKDPLQLLQLPGRRPGHVPSVRRQPPAPLLSSAHIRVSFRGNALPGERQQGSSAGEVVETLKLGHQRLGSRCLIFAFFGVVSSLTDSIPIVKSVCWARVLQDWM